MAISSSLSPVFPLGSRLNDLGRLEIGGCDTVDLANQFGTPAYVVAEDDLRARARTFISAAARMGAGADEAGDDAERAGDGPERAGDGPERAGDGPERAGDGAERAGDDTDRASAGADRAGHGTDWAGDGAEPIAAQQVQIVYASKAFPCTAILEIFAQEGLLCDVASEGELHLALGAGFRPDQIVLHGNAKSTSELQMALRVRVGLIVVDNFDEISRLESLLAGGAQEPQEVLIRVAPDIRGDTHEKISTGQARTKFGFSVADVPSAVERIHQAAGLRLVGLHAHIGSQLLDLDPFRRAATELARLSSSVGAGDVLNVGGGLGVRYTDDQAPPPPIDSYVEALAEAVRNPSQAGAPQRLPSRLLIEPGRALTANGCVTLYSVESVKRNVSTWVAVDGGMSDNSRPMLYGASYEAQIADRFGGETECILAGKHCESGDVIVPKATLDDPRPGDLVVTPATGAYCYAMASNYNGILRAPVVICKDGDARLAVRRETLDDLTLRDTH